MLLLLLACASPTAPEAPPPPGRRPGPDAGGSPPELVIPVDEPSWARLDGLLDQPQAYGEASWDDVRMRVAGHLAIAGRDRARLHVAAGDWAGCARAYSENAAALEGLRLGGEVGPPIRAALVAAARRDAALCDALAGGPAPAPGEGTIAPLRARWVGLVLRARAGEPVAAEAAALAADARAVAAPPGLELDAFADFEARHRLRVRLVQAWADAASPFVATEPFDYWTGAELPRLAAGFAAAADAVGAGATPEALAPDRALPPAPAVAYTAEELGALVTGDSTIDTLGFAGPRAIGKLARLGSDDPEHRAWLEATAAELQAAPPDTVPALVARRVAELEAFPGGIRYYAIKQLRNSAVRHLARAGAHDAALQVLATSWPLHAQDWACPDRAAILVLIEARLKLLAGAADAAEANARAHQEIDAFLAHVAAVEARPGPAGGRGGPPGPPPAPGGRPSGPPPPGR